mmetsp:Transcript_9424/g.14209  ORF Transcript_9424/g.14209 Transcript_9424/m.14209 type:complete len:393 (+) Transcript_9424:1-1179(+)
MTNDIVIPCCIGAWYATHHLGWDKLILQTPVQMVWLLFAMTFKVNGLCNTINLAMRALPPSAYYPIPLIGPIVAGVVQGSMGMLLPFDKGLSPIQSGTPVTMQRALIGAISYHLIINDTHGILGRTVRIITGRIGETDMRLLLVIFWFCISAQQTLFGPHVNFMTPVYSFIYRIFKIKSTNSPSAAYVTRSGPSVWRMFIKRIRTTIGPYRDHIQATVIVTAVCVFVLARAPPSQITQRQHMALSKPLVGSCVAVSAIRDCIPYSMKASLSQENDSTLVTLHVEELASAFFWTYPVPTREVWRLMIPISSSKHMLTDGSDMVLHISARSELRISSIANDKVMELLWESRPFCVISGTDNSWNSNVVSISLNASTGIPYITCHDKSKMELTQF